MAKRYAIDTVQIIVWNYPVAVWCTWFFLRPDWTNSSLLQAPILLVSGLALLLPGVFVLLAASIRHAGIVRTEVAQRLSLFIALIAAFWLFNETPHTGKLTGVVVGITGILCCIGWHRQPGEQAGSLTWLYPMLVFVGYGVIDILFKQVAQHTEVSYSLSMLIVFVLAACVSFCYLAYRLFATKSRFSFPAVWWGLILGGFNFANILFYMRAHRALPENPSIVFTGMNVGVIALGAVVGIAVFKEKLSFTNKIGIILAVVSVLIIAYS